MCVTRTGGSTRAIHVYIDVFTHTLNVSFSENTNTVLIFTSKISIIYRILRHVRFPKESRSLIKVIFLCTPYFSVKLKDFPKNLYLNHEIDLFLRTDSKKLSKQKSIKNLAKSKIWQVNLKFICPRESTWTEIHIRPN